MNQPAFFQSGNNFKVPASHGLYPFSEETCVIAVTQGAGADHARAFHRKALDRTMKTAHDFECLRHGLGIEVTVAKDTFTQTGDLAVLMERNQMSTAKFGNTEPN